MPWPKGRSQSEQHRERVGAALKQYYTNPEVRKALSERLKGKAGRKPGVPCVEGCRCGRHMDKGRKCEPECSCGRHDLSMRARQRAMRIGSSLSERQRLNISRGVKRSLGKHSEDCRCWTCQPKETLPEQLFREYVLSDFPTVLPQRWFGGRYRVDFYLPAPYHLAIEIDGDHDAEYDRKRDAWLLEQFGLPVVRVKNEEVLRAVLGV